MTQKTALSILLVASAVAFAQPPVADHTAHVQVLDRDHVVLADQACADLVQEVAPRIGHPRMHPGDLASPFCVVR
jgi:translation initiation factor 2 gamma subunit (eIF-2gamma)